MPASRAVLADVERLGLDPTVPHSHIGAGQTLKVIHKVEISSEINAVVNVEEQKTLKCVDDIVKENEPTLVIAVSTMEQENACALKQHENQIEEKVEVSEKKSRVKRKTIIDPSS